MVSGGNVVYAASCGGAPRRHGRQARAMTTHPICFSLHGGDNRDDRELGRDGYKVLSRTPTGEVSYGLCDKLYLLHDISD